MDMRMAGRPSKDGSATDKPVNGLIPDGKSPIWGPYLFATPVDCGVGVKVEAEVGI